MPRLSRISLLLAAIACLTPHAAPAQGGGGNPDACNRVCTFSAGCTAQCQKGGITGPWTTCGEWRGNPASDLDSDGVLNTLDNCTCNVNLDQANCDGDSLGDVCDTVDNSGWTFLDVADLSKTCAIYHRSGGKAQFYSRNLYRRTCTPSQTCTKNVSLKTVTCGLLPDKECCIAAGVPIPICSAILWDLDQCGLPKCPF